MMLNVDNLILGAGIAGLGASHAIQMHSKDALILEKGNTYGGLCSNIVIDGFRFDRFVHFSFTSNENVRFIFDKSAGNVIKHVPNPFNWYHGKWIKHPAQNNLYPLSQLEKDTIIDGFLNRRPSNSVIKNYEDWLRIQYGDSFAERFPFVYTRKYWGGISTHFIQRRIGLNRQ